MKALNMTVLLYLSRSKVSTQHNSFPHVFYENIKLSSLDTYIYLCCFALFVCLTLLASFFLPSHLPLKHVYMCILYCTDEA